MTEISDNSRVTTQRTVDQLVWSACDVLRRSNCASAIQYVPELTWILFLRVLDERERIEAENAEAVGADYRASLEAPYRWRDWAAPEGAKRRALTGGAMNAYFAFVNDDLLPYLRSLKQRPDATEKQKVISEIMSGVDRTRVDTERNLLDVIDRIHRIPDHIDAQHYFMLSQVYEGLLLKMGEKAGDGGQFFTPREVIRAIVRTVDPKVGETVYDPCCGTGGFLAESYNHMRRKLGNDATPRKLTTLKTETFYGREKENLVYPIALANLVLHEIDRPNLWHGNTLTGHTIYGGLFDAAPSNYDVIVTNPPFGGKEGLDAQTNYAYRTSATQVLFLQQVIKELADGGRCGMVIDEGVLFRTTERAFVQTKRQLLDGCDLWCIVSLPPGVFTAAGAGVKTNLLFFTKGRKTERVWYYDVSDLKVTKTKPFTLDRMADFFERLPKREGPAGESERSWWVDSAAIAESNYDLKAVNPNRKAEVDQRTPAELLDEIEARGREVDEAIANLRGLLSEE